MAHFNFYEHPASNLLFAPWCHLQIIAHLLPPKNKMTQHETTTTKKNTKKKLKLGTRALHVIEHHRPAFGHQFPKVRAPSIHQRHQALLSAAGAQEELWGLKESI